MACKKRKPGKKAQVAMYLAFIIVATVVILITAFAAPMGARISTKFYEAGENILLATQADLNDINDSTVRDRINASLVNAMAAQENNIDITTALYQYSWIFVVALAAVMVFLMSRAIVEFRTGGYGGFI